MAKKRIKLERWQRIHMHLQNCVAENRAFPTNKALAKRFKCSAATIVRDIELLRERALIVLAVLPAGREAAIFDDNRQLVGIVKSKRSNTVTREEPAYV